MRQPDARWLTTVVLCATAAAARLIVGAHIADDAYITMRYSRNLAAAGAMSYNPPDAVLGTSTPLWTWILAAGSVAGVAPETTAVAVASVADLGSIVLILASPVGGTLGAIVSAVTIAAWPAYVMYAVSGMETSLYVLTIVAFVTAMSSQRTVLSAAAASVGALCRPDGALLIVLGFAWTLFTQSRRAAMQFALAAILLCAPWGAYAFVRFSSVIPSSVSAKASAADPWFLSVQNLGAYFFQGIYVPITLLALVGFVLITRRGHTFWRVWSVWAWAYLAAMTAANGFTHFPWYFVPLLPVYTAAAATTLEGGWHFLRKGGWHLSGEHLSGEHLSGEHLSGEHLSGEGGWHLSRKGGWHRWRESCATVAVLATSAAPAGAVVVLSAGLLSRMPSLKSYLEATAEGRETLYASVATELAGVDSRCTLAATEIGTLGYHYPGRVLDLVGLVSPEVVGRPVEDVLADSRARWLVTYDTHFDRAVAGGQRFTSLFERRSTVRINDVRTLEIYERRDRAACERH